MLGYFLIIVFKPAETECMAGLRKEETETTGRGRDLKPVLQDHSFALDILNFSNKELKTSAPF